MERRPTAAQALRARGNFAQEIQLVQHDTRAFRHCANRVLGHMNRQPCLFRDKLVPVSYTHLTLPTSDLV